MYKRRRTQASILCERGRELEAIAPTSPGGGTRGLGSEGAIDECGEHFSCCDVVPGGLEVQGLGKGPPGVLTCGAVERWSAGAGACRARRVVRVEVRARAGHGIGVVCGYRRVLGMALRCAVRGCGRVLGTAGGAGGLRGEKTRCAYERKIGW